MVSIKTIEYYIKNKDERIKSKGFFYSETAYIFFYMMIDFILSREFTLDENKYYTEAIQKNGSDKTVWLNYDGISTITAKEYLLKKLNERTKIEKTVKDPVVIPNPPKVISDTTQKAITIQEQIDKIVNDTKKIIKGSIDVSKIAIPLLILIIFIFIKKWK